MLKTRPLSKWMTAERVANAGSAGSSATFMSTVSAPTDFGLAARAGLAVGQLDRDGLLAVDGLGEPGGGEGEDQRAGEGQRHGLAQWVLLDVGRGIGSSVVYNA